MGEVTSFRLARAPQRSADATVKRLILSDTAQIAEWLAAGNDAREFAVAYLAEQGLAAPARRFSTSEANAAAMLELIRWLDRSLLKNNNRVGWNVIAADAQARFAGNAQEVLVRNGWAALRALLSNALVAILIARGEVAVGTDVMRLLLVMGLLETIAEAGPIDADTMFQMLRWRHVALPPGLLLLPFVNRSVLARRPGVSDLYIVREEWARYELGEIAHIENVLKGELKRSLLEKTDEQETTVTTDTSATRTAQQDNQTTDRFELKASSQVDTSLALHVEGKVDTSGVYGPTKVDSHLGGTFDYSVQEADSRATTQARETVARATSSIEESVRTQRIERTLTRTRTLDRHELNNTAGDDHVTGIYRWVDKIQTVQIFKYPHRLLYEFEVPEPGAFIRWLNAQPKTGALRPIRPFTVDGTDNGAVLTPYRISGFNPPPVGELNYLELGRRYDVQGLPPPPTDRTVFAAITNDQPDDVANNNRPPVYKTSNVTIPDGYEGYRFTIFATATNDVPEQEGAPTGWLEIVVGTDFPSMQEDDGDPQQIWRWQGVNVFRDMKSMAFRQPVIGQVPILLATDDTSGLMANLQIFCRPTETTVQQWRLQVFDLILGAYLAQQRQQADAAARAAIQQGIVISGDSATRNAEVVREEVKRATIELLMGERFNGRPAMQDVNNGPPRIDFDAVRRISAEIQFVEEAFEWENLSFVLYPYYWADATKWADLERIGSPDAAFDRFLRAGSARVVLPSRPGFEAATQLYTIFGLLWGGGPAPAPDDDLYLSIADEIRAQQLAPADGTPGEHWEVRLPTTLVYLSPLGTALPLENDHAELPKVPEEGDPGQDGDGQGGQVPRNNRRRQAQEGGALLRRRVRREEVPVDA